jgi:hydrogenase maturation protease
VPLMADLKLAIIGCGNPNRSDDGVGATVINVLRQTDLPDYVTLYDAGTDGMGVMYAAKGSTHLIVIDARAPEGKPGAIYEVPGEVLAAPKEQSMNLHDFRWDHALYAGQKIYRDEFPKFVKVFLIEAQTLELNIGLTEKVAHAATEVIQQVHSLACSANLDWSSE